jgi:hypothetical protein
VEIKDISNVWWHYTIDEPSPLLCWFGTNDDYFVPAHVLEHRTGVAIAALELSHHPGEQLLVVSETFHFSDRRSDYRLGWPAQGASSPAVPEP